MIFVVYRDAVFAGELKLVFQCLDVDFRGRGSCGRRGTRYKNGLRQDGRRYIGASPSNKSVQSLKDKVGAILAPGNMGRWEDVCAQLTRLMRGWCGYFSPGSHYVTDRVIEAHIYDRVRNFLVRRHKVPTRIGPFTMTAVFGDLGVPRLRHCRRQGVLS